MFLGKSLRRNTGNSSAKLTESTTSICQPGKTSSFPSILKRQANFVPSRGTFPKMTVPAKQFMFFWMFSISERMKTASWRFGGQSLPAPRKIRRPGEFSKFSGKQSFTAQKNMTLTCHSQSTFLRAVISCTRSPFRENRLPTAASGC